MSGMDFAAVGANLGRQLMGGGDAFEAGRTKMAQFLADANYKQAQGDYYASKANNERQRASYQTPEFGGKIAAELAGLSDEQASALENYRKTGKWGMSPAMPDEAKQMTMAPAPLDHDWATPEVMQRYNMGKAAHLISLGGTGDSNADQITKALESLLGQNRIDAVVADPSKAAALGQAMAASQGKALFNQGSNGVMDNFTGVERINDVGRSVIGENNAQASNAYASAGAHNANRQKTMAEIPEIQSKIDLNRSKIGQPTINPDGSITGPTGKPVKLSATAEKELFEADDGVQAGKNIIGILNSALDINDKAYSGYGAKMRAVARSNLPGQSEAADATINLDNMMTGQALESLKMVFGGMPTEGERKILLEMQASAEKTPEQRKQIITRAIEAAKKRVIFNTNKAKALRSGTHNIADPQGQFQEPSIDDLLKKYGG